MKYGSYFPSTEVRLRPVMLVGSGSVKYTHNTAQNYTDPEATSRMKEYK